MSKTYVSAVPLTMVRLAEGGYSNVLQGDPIAGEAVDADDLKRLVRKGFLKEFDGGSNKAAKKSAAGGDSKPTSVKDILAEVGDDKAKAQEYLDEENAKGEDARGSLVGKLQSVIDAES